MKRLEDIENLSVTDLERIASDDSIIVPETLKRDIARTARTLEMLEEEESAPAAVKRRKRPVLLRLAYPAVAAAIAAVALYFSFSGNPKDSFDDPMMAYAQVEDVFTYITEKMNTGVEIANSAEPAFEKTINVLR